MRGGSEDSEDLCDPDDPRYLWPRYDLEVSGFLEFPPRLSDFEGSRWNRSYLTSDYGNRLEGSVCEALYRACKSCILVYSSVRIIRGLQPLYQPVIKRRFTITKISIIRIVIARPVPSYC